MPASPRTLAAMATKAKPEAWPATSDSDPRLNTRRLITGAKVTVCAETTKDAGAVGDTSFLALGHRWEELEPKGAVASRVLGVHDAARLLCG